MYARGDVEIPINVDPARSSNSSSPAKPWPERRLHVVAECYLQTWQGLGFRMVQELISVNPLR